MRIDKSILLVIRKIVRRLNWVGFFVDLEKSVYPSVVLAGYTRSGTTYLGSLLSSVTGTRPIHEPLNPGKVKEVEFFAERESADLVREQTRYRNALGVVFGPNFRGCRYTNTGFRLTYRGRVVKIVRGNHYVDYLSERMPEVPFIVIMRNPCACIASRLRSGWSIPDYTNCFPGISRFLSQEQIDLYYKAEGKLARLTVSWCLDNLMLLRNRARVQFKFVHYEDLVLQPQDLLQNLLKHIDKQQFLSRVEPELALVAPKLDQQGYLSRWKESFGEDDITQIREILQVFGLESYYDLETGLPKHISPFD